MHDRYRAQLEQKPLPEHRHQGHLHHPNHPPKGTHVASIWPARHCNERQWQDLHPSQIHKAS
ncbi:MAG: hypothetical protein ACKPKO_02710, partial [Candidatus Fonsibacter sp.]